MTEKIKDFAPGEDRTHDLQIALIVCDYETDALPTALPRHMVVTSLMLYLVVYL